VTTAEDVGDRLTWWLRGLLDADDVSVEGLDRVDFGHSAEMLSLTVVTERDGTSCCRDVVVRLRPRPPALLEPYDLERQFRILSALEATDVRVPPALWIEPTGDVLGRPFFVMERVAGTVYELEAPDVTADRARRMCEGLAEQLAAVHRVDVDAVGLAGLADGDGHLTRELGHWADEMRRVARGPLPALERLLAELRATAPAPYPRVTLVHGDAKPGNFAFVGDDVSAVFDWEMTTLGDPLTDIGWLELLWMQPVGLTSHPGACGIDELLARYTEVSGITPQHRPWYRALNAYKMAVICLIGSMLFADGSSADERFALNAMGIPLLTQLGLSELGVTEKFEDGPVLAR
jgi:aminoglycoside phosphotransferase (APT) family kinase protein